MPDGGMQRLTVPVVDQFIADLKDAVRDAKLAPSGQGTMVMLYGAYFPMILSNAVLPPAMRMSRVGQATSAGELTRLLDVCRTGPVEPRWTNDGRARRGGVLGHDVQGVRF